MRWSIAVPSFAFLALGIEARAFAQVTSSARDLFGSLVANERRHLDLPKFSGLPRVPRAAAPPGSTKNTAPIEITDLNLDVRIDPKTNTIDAKIVLKGKALKSLSSLVFYLDPSLKVTGATSPGRTVTYSTARAALSASPAFTANENVTIELAYGGTLACDTPDGSHSYSPAACEHLGVVTRHVSGSFLPYLLSEDGGTLPYPYTIAITTTDGSDVHLSGIEQSNELIGAERKVVSSCPWPMSLPLYAFVGSLGTLPVDSSQLLFLYPSNSLDLSRRAWTPSALGFLETFSSQKLVYPKMQFMRLPKTSNDPGTVACAMTLLNEMFDRVGDVFHEEVWAHENSHQIFGGAVTHDGELSRIYEGFASMVEIDYTYAHHFSTRDRDDYLSDRYSLLLLDIDRVGATVKLPPIVAPSQKAAQLEQPEYSTWAYHMGAAMLEHLRATVGEASFMKGIAAYASACSFKPCAMADLQGAMEQASGKDFTKFFANFVTDKIRIPVSTSFTTTKTGADLVVTQDRSDPMTLEVWVTLENGAREKRIVELTGETTTAPIAASGTIRFIRPSPLHGFGIDASSAAAGDLDFDGEVDGTDLLLCARSVGEKLSTYNTGIYVLEPPFDRRCDVNHDLVVDDEDLAAIQENFGQVRGTK